MDFEEWIIGEMDRGLSQLEVDQMRAAWEAATKAEREACTKVCDDYSKHRDITDFQRHSAGQMRDEIKARSNA